MECSEKDNNEEWEKVCSLFTKCHTCDEHDQCIWNPDHPENKCKHKSLLTEFKAKRK